MSSPLFRAFASIIVVSVLAGCGGGGGGATTPATPVVPVVPPPPAVQYTVGGTIVGLGNVSGLVLAGPGGPLEIPSGSVTFAFPTTLTQGMAYSVAVQTQPASATCVLGEAAGTAGATSSNSVKVTCNAIPQSTGLVLTLAGTGIQGYANGAGKAAQFLAFNQVATDETGLVYVSDFWSIRKISPAGEVSALAGWPGSGSYNGPVVVDSTGPDARFQTPDGLVVDKFGNVFIADLNNHRIRKITPQGVVTTVAGGTAGYLDGPAATARFYFPSGIALDGAGNLYVAELTRVRKISVNGIVSTFAGSGNTSFADGTGTQASFNLGSSVGMAVDSLDNIYLTDQGNRRIRKISPQGVVTTIAGSGASGMQDGAATAASFAQPEGLALNRSNGDLYVIDSSNQAVRKISNGQVSTVTGMSHTAGFADGSLSAAKFNNPTGIAIDKTGNLYVADRSNFRIRKICPAAAVAADCIAAAVAPTQTFNLGGIVSGLGNASGLVLGNAQDVLTVPANSTAFTFGSQVPAGSSYSVSVLTQPTGKSCTVSMGSGTVISAPVTSVKIDCADTAGPGVYSVGGNINGLGAASGLVLSNGGRSLAILPYATSFVFPTMYPQGSSYAVSVLTQPTGYTCSVPVGSGTIPAAAVTSVRVVCAAGDVKPVIAVYAGDGTIGYLDGQSSSARFKHPFGIVLDATGNLYTSDVNDYLIRKVSVDGIVSTLAGNLNNLVFSDGVGTAATFFSPQGLAIDKSGNIYVADTNHYRIRKITPAGLVSTFAGSGKSGVTNGTGTSAQFSNPNHVVFDTSGNLYVSDFYSIRRITPSGVVTTFAGSTGLDARTVDGTGTNARFSGVGAMDIDSAGNIYVLEQNQIRKVTPAGVVSTFSGSGSRGEADGGSSSASFYSLHGIAIHPQTGAIFVGDEFALRRVSLDGSVTTVLKTDAVFRGLDGLKFDSSGNLFATGAARILKVSNLR